MLEYAPTIDEAIAALKHHLLSQKVDITVSPNRTASLVIFVPYITSYTLCIPHKNHIFPKSLN